MSDNDPRDEFVMIAREIIATLEAPRHPDRWWKDIEGLTHSLETCRRDIGPLLLDTRHVTTVLPLLKAAGIEDVPALLVVTQDAGEDVPEVARHRPEFPRLDGSSGLQTVTNMLCSEPWKRTAHSQRNLFIRYADGRERVCHWRDTRQTAVFCLQAWMRAVQEVPAKGETPPKTLFGITLEGRTAKRYVPATEQTVEVIVVNDYCHDLLKELLNGEGHISRDRAKKLFPDTNDRNYVARTLRDKLEELQLTLTDWTIREFSG